ncbi:adenosine deaminase [Glutamicibacter sp. AOP5-A2-7]
MPWAQRSVWRVSLETASRSISTWPEQLEWSLSATDTAYFPCADAATDRSSHSLVHFPKGQDLKLPVAELHIHLEGSLEPETIFALAAKNRIALPYQSVEELREQYDFNNLQSFLDLFYANMAVLRTSEDFHEITRAYLQRAHDSGVRHVELFFDPQAHLERGLTLSDVISGISAGLDEAKQRWGMTHKLIACFWRHAPAATAMEILQLIVSEKHDIDGIGLDSSELGFPPELFTEVFAYAREHGLHLVAHAGEEGPADYIRQALDLLRVERVDHGIRCLEDPELVTRLVNEQMPLTVCPFSNVRLRAVDTLADHPLPQMLEAGLKVSIHSDDPAYFGGYMDANFSAITEQFSLTASQLATLARNSFDGSFLEAGEKAARVAEVDAWLELQADAEPR